MKENQLKNCNFIKTILMLCVIIGHACAFWSGKWYTENPIYNSESLNVLYSWISSFHVFAFTLVSGYIFEYKISKGDYATFIPFILNKIKRLIVPYVFVAIIWVIPISALLLKWDYKTIFIRYVLCIDPSQLWFLWMLFGVFLISWILRKAIVPKPLIGYLLCICFYAIGIIGRQLFSNVFCIWTVFQYLLFFYIGMRKRYVEENNKTSSLSFPWFVWFLLDLLVFGVYYFVSLPTSFVWICFKNILELTVYLIGSLMAWSLLNFVGEKTHIDDSKFFRKLTACSMPMYLFHQQIIYFSINIFNGLINPWINAGLNFVIAFVVSLLISVLLLNWKTTSFLVGKKF